jgi:DNA modification methylase
MGMIQLIHGDCLEKIKDIPDGSVDLTVTSPPYDNLRTYNGNISQWNEQKWKDILVQLYRVTKHGGVVVWVVGDATINGSETGTSFKQALFAKECGFNLHDTMIWEKSSFIPLTHNRYEQCYEYMFVFSKARPKVFNPIMDKCIFGGNKSTGTFRHDKNNLSYRHTTIVNKNKISKNIRTYPVTKKASGHPAAFPEQLVTEHILTWSNEGDTIFDCFMGSGTTGIACKNLGRSFIGIELDEGYFNIAKQRIDNKEARTP